MIDDIVQVFVPVLLLLSVATQATERVSTASGGAEGNGESVRAVTSDDGRYVVFDSGADNLVASDSNSLRDIFLKDTQTGTTIRVSTGSNGSQATNGHSHGPAISSDGRYVVFASGADNLVAGDTNGVNDIFLKDRQTDVTTRVSTDSNGSQASSGGIVPGISADGRYVVFQSAADNLVGGDTNGAFDIFLKNMQTEQVTRVSTDSSGVEGAGGSVSPAINSDGRYVVFQSAADNLVEGDTNGADDIFLKNLQTGQLTRVSTDSNGSQASSGGIVPGISADGRYVVFESNADNLVAGDTNGAFDIFLKDTYSGVTRRVSTDSSGAQANSGNLRPVISADGRYVAFDSFASNLVTGDTNGSKDILVKDMANGTTTRVSTDSSGSQGNNSSVFPVISADGRYVVFASLATNLVAADTNRVFDVFRNTNPAHVDDTDGDRVRNDIELIAGTDPNNADTDGDGASDYDELNRNLDPYTYNPGADTDPNDPDTDDDGYRDGYEDLVGSDPLDTLSIPVPNGDLNMDGLVGPADIVIGHRILHSLHMPTVQQTHLFDIAPLVGVAPQPDGNLNSGDLVVLYRWVQGYW